VHNAIISPLKHFTVRGVLWDHGLSNKLAIQPPESRFWFSGESVTELNSLNSSQFLCATSELVADWRSLFFESFVPADQGNVAFPVGIVQVLPGLYYIFQMIA